MIVLNLTEEQARNILENFSWATSYWGRTDIEEEILEILDNAISSKGN